ncbi:MAG TPA: macro domain-containing protein [Nitrososphaeraceae archaeon]|nr:macro domain-containing protein [Nitrososphaeraceae archaeon]
MKLFGGHEILLISEITIGKRRKLRLVRGDITERNVDVIVNAANSNLNHGGGVAAAIVAKGGQIIQDESDKIGYVPVGNAVMTTAGKLPCKAVIHVVGPRYGEGKEEKKLRLAINNVLNLAEQNNFKSISIPAISTGIFGFPKEKCAKILVEESINFAEKQISFTSLPEIIEFCIYDDETLQHFKKEFTNTNER